MAILLLTSNGLVDGVLLMEVCLDDDRVEALSTAGRPLAMIGRTADPSSLAHVDIDFEQTLNDAVDHLHQLGHHRIAFVNHDRSEHEAGYGPAVRALDAYSRAMTRHQLEPISRFCGDNPAAGAAPPPRPPTRATPGRHRGRRQAPVRVRVRGRGRGRGSAGPPTRRPGHRTSPPPQPG